MLRVRGSSNTALDEPPGTRLFVNRFEDGVTQGFSAFTLVMSAQEQAGGDSSGREVYTRRVTPNSNCDTGRVNLPSDVVDKLGAVGGGEVAILVRDDGTVVLVPLEEFLLGR